MLNKIEKTVLLELSKNLNLYYDIDLDNLSIKEKRFTGCGFFTEFKKKQSTKIFKKDKNLTWSKLGILLKNDQHEIDTGYIVYINDCYLDTIEGFTYEEEWPSNYKISKVYYI